MKLRISKDRSKQNEPCHYPERWDPIDERWLFIKETKIGDTCLYLPTTEYGEPVTLDKSNAILKSYMGQHQKREHSIDLETVKIIEPE